MPCEAARFTGPCAGEMDHGASRFSLPWCGERGEKSDGGTGGKERDCKAGVTKRDGSGKKTDVCGAEDGEMALAHDGRRTIGDDMGELYIREDRETVQGSEIYAPKKIGENSMMV